MSNIVQGKMMSTEAYAFARHAFDRFWRDFALVDTNQAALIPAYTFRSTMENFRNAVIAYGETIRRFKTNREHTTMKKHVPEETLKQFPTLIRIDPTTYTFSLTAELEDAFKQATGAVAAYAQAHN